VLLVSSLDVAGAERSNANLANLLNSRGVSVLVLTYRKDKPDFYELDQGVERAWADFSPKGWTKIRLLREQLAAWAPDVVVSSGNKTNVRALLAGLGQPWKTVVVERNDPSQQPIELRWGVARFFVYRWAHRLVSISRGVDRYFWFLPRAQRAVISNTFPEHGIQRAPGERCTVIGVGRLVLIKGFDRLIEAFARVADRFPEWRLVIWGDGEERERLTELINRLGILSRVELPGLTDKPLVELAKADLLVVPSRSEGFGNVIVEAMSVGLPVVSFDCPSGPRDIIDSDTSGILVPDGRVDLLAQTMESLMADPERRKVLAAGGLARAAEFSPQNHVDRWLRLLNAVVA